jgi:hypothetical protein
MATQRWAPATYARNAHFVSQIADARARGLDARVARARS